MSSGSSSMPKMIKKKFRVKHQKVKLFRANEPILSVFMWGINHTVNITKLDSLENLSKIFCILQTDKRIEPC